MKISKKQVTNMTLEEALSELEKVVDYLSSNSDNLSDAVEAYRYGDELKNYCYKKIDDAKLTIEKIKNNDS